MNYTELVKSLREYAEYIGPNNYELPIMLYDHLLQAADAIETLVSYAGEWKAAYIMEHDARTAEYRTDKERQAAEEWEKVQKRLRREEKQ